MPRPKGSKNKKTVSIQENVEEKIAAVEAEIAELGTQLKAKKAELKQLVKAKAESDRIAAERKVEEDKKALAVARRDAFLHTGSHGFHIPIGELVVTFFFVGADRPGKGREPDQEQRHADQAADLRHSFHFTFSFRKQKTFFLIITDAERIRHPYL